MVKPLQKPPRKNPLKRSRAVTPPPLLRSRAMLGFSARAAEGCFSLQNCAECGAIFYPARDICPSCWSEKLIWKDAKPRGKFLAETVLNNSTNVYFRERMPWRVGTIKTADGPTLMAHIHEDICEGDEVRLIARTDKSGQGVVMALPLDDTKYMLEDKIMRELNCDPKFRRVLITDVTNPVGQALARELVKAEVGKVFLGIPETWKPFPNRNEVLGLPNSELAPLDVTQTDSITKLAGSIGGKVDILINTAQHCREGSPLTRKGLVTAQDEMDVNYFGLLRLLQGFADTMRARAADGDNSATAWVNIISIYALSNWPRYGLSSASQAAALSLMQSIRSDFHGSGIKTVNVLHGPVEEDEWMQQVSPPKVPAVKIAQQVVGALQQGIEQVLVGDVAQDIYKRWVEDPTVLERELTQVKISD